MLSVRADLIVTRLLSEEGKHDMLDGSLTDEALYCHVKCWIEAGMPDYANGKFEPYAGEPEKPMARYRGNGKR